MTSPIITEATRVLVDRRDLTRIEAAGAMEAIMSGMATDAQIAAFLTALRMKGETVEELIGFAQVMRSKVARVHTRAEETAALTGTARAGRPVRGRGRHRLPLRAAPAHGDEARHDGAARGRHPDGVQSPRPADQPGRRERPGDRRRGRGAHGAARPGARRARHVSSLR